MLSSTPDVPHPDPRLSIEPARLEDAEEIVRVVMSSRRVFIPYAPIAHGEAAMGDWMRGLLAIPQCVSVARLHGATVGVLVIVAETGLNWIDQLYVAPGHTGKGIGGELLRHALHSLGRERPVRLYTFLANTGARKFYERAGFRAIAFGDGSGNEEKCSDVLYQLDASPRAEDRGQ